MQDIIENNKTLFNVYFMDLHTGFIKSFTSNLNNTLTKIVNTNKSIYDETNTENFIKFNKNLFNTEVDNFYIKIE